MYDPKHNASVYKYKKNNIKRVPLDMQISDYEKVSEAASSSGETVNGYIKEAIWRRLDQDGYDISSLKSQQDNEK